MNVWMVNHYALPASQAGITRHYSFAKELLKQGHQTTIWASSFNHLTKRERLKDGEGAKLEVVDGVPFYWIRTPAYKGNSPARIWNMLAFSYQMWRLGRKHDLAKPDVILGSSPHLFAALAAERLSNYFGVPFVLEVRDLWPQSLIDLGGVSPNHPIIMLLDKIERYLYRKASVIVTLLPDASEYITTKGADASKIVWIPNGIDLELIPTPLPPQPKESFTVMYGGNYGLAYDLELALESAYILEREGWGERVRFRFVGNGPKKSELIDKAQRLGLRNVYFEDPVSKSEFYTLLSQADALLFPLKNFPLYRWGISPSKLFDYMASARPIIFCANVPFNPVTEAKAGISVPPGNARVLADAIKYLTLLPLEERWKMGLSGRKYIEENYLIESFAKKLEEVLLEKAFREFRIKSN